MKAFDRQVATSSGRNLKLFLFLDLLSEEGVLFLKRCGINRLGRFLSAGLDDAVYLDRFLALHCSLEILGIKFPTIYDSFQ